MKLSPEDLKMLNGGLEDHTEELDLDDPDGADIG